MGFGGTWFPLAGSILVVVVSVARLIARVPWRRALPQGVFAIYVLFAFDMALLPVRLDADWRAYSLESLAYWRNSVNLVPLRTIVAQLSPGAPPTAFRQVLGNLALLLPFGVLAPVVFRFMRRPRAFLIAALSVALGIEALQVLQKVTLIGSRSIDVDDALLNTIGALAGYALWRVSSKLRSRLSAAQPDVLESDRRRRP